MTIAQGAPASCRLAGRHSAALCGDWKPPGQPPGRRRSVYLLSLLLFATSLHAATLSFDDALARAFKARGIETAFTAGIARLEQPVRMQPVVRVETTAQTSENVEVIADRVARFDALSAIVLVDYPLLDRGAGARRMARARTDAQLFRQRALDEAEMLFTETLDAYAQLYLAQARQELFRDAVAHAVQLRERAQTLLVSGRITNVVAANWEEQALAIEAAQADLDVQRLDAETRLKQLMGEGSDEPIQAITLSSRASSEGPRSGLGMTSAAVDRRRLDLAEVEAAQRPQLLLSAFGGVASLSNPSGRTFGLYGLRMTFTLPSRDPARIAEAQLELEGAERAREAAGNAKQRKLRALTLAFDASQKRIELLTRTIVLAKERQASMTRLVSGGVRTDSDLTDAANEVAKRESDLLAERVAAWKLARTLERLQAP